MKTSKPSKRPGAKITPRFRIYLNREIVLGPGKADLLEQIAQTGSISEAARRMKMSYNRAWLHVKIMNDNFSKPLVTSSRGGDDGGGASLTPLGEKVLRLYKLLNEESEAAIAKTSKELLRLL